MSKTYTGKDIKVLDELSHIRLNAGMYIGDTSNPVHLVEEALDNALDECLGGHATIVAVNIDTKTNTYCVLDNGRGIPFDNDTPITISTKLFSGAKFQDSKSAYLICCLAGSTKPLLLSGENLTIEKMSKNPNKQYFGLSSTPDGKWKVSQLLAPQITGYVNKMIRVYFDNEKFEESTPDHLFMMRDGTYKQAGDLKENDSLMPCYTRDKDGYIQIKPNNTYDFIRNISYENKGYIQLHKLVYKDLFDKIPKNYTVHHKVIRIEEIETKEKIPVYDVYVPEYSNFVLDSGVVVHNSGLHGVGLVALNALSSSYIIEIYRDGKHAKFIFENAKLKEKRIEPFSGEAPFSTKIQFKPDKKIFETLVPDISRIRTRLAVASVELDKVTLVLTVDGNKEVFRLNSLGYFNQECLNDSDNETTKIVDISVSESIESMSVKFCYSLNGTIAPRILSSVNLLPVDSGGTHVNAFLDIIKDLFMARAKKVGLKFHPQDSLCGLRAYLTLKLQKPEFSGQTKDKIINRKDYLSKLTSKLKSAIEAFFANDPEELDLLLNQFADYRKKLDSKKLKASGNGKRASTKFTKLRDCTSVHGELFITEGDSAGGSLLQCRDPRSHAVLPLKGKIPSIVNAKEILKNQEIGELIQALGTGVGPHFDMTKLKYNKVICAADADFDGYHIFCLLTIILAVLVPDIVKNGHYYLAQTPLYAINKGKTFIPLWTKDDLDKAKKKGEPITRFKGLGELSPWQLKICLLDNNTRHLTKIKYSKNLDEMLKLFSDVNEKRILLADDSIGEVEI